MSKTSDSFEHSCWQECQQVTTTDGHTHVFYLPEGRDDLIAFELAMEMRNLKHLVADYPTTTPSLAGTPEYARFNQIVEITGALNLEAYFTMALHHGQRRRPQ